MLPVRVRSPAVHLTASQFVLAMLAQERESACDHCHTCATRLSRSSADPVLKQCTGLAMIKTTQEYPFAAVSLDYERAREALNTMNSTATAFLRDARCWHSMEANPSRESESKATGPCTS